LARRRSEITVEGSAVGTVVVGVDASKASLSVWREGAHREVPNRRKEVRRWVRSLPPGTALGVEATNRYHELLVEEALEAGLTAYVLNPREVRSYKDSLSHRAKTDRLDCEYVARFLERERDRLFPYVPPGRRHGLAGALLRQRDLLCRSRLSLQQSSRELPALAGRLVREAVREALGALEAAVGRCELLLASLLREDPTYRRLLRVPGVGPLGAAGLCAAVSSRPFASADAFVAFVGLDLRVEDSGALKGKRRLSKRGDPLLRKLLYLAAAALSRTAKGRAAHQSRLDRGVARVASLVHLARKTARLVWALHTRKTDFDPAKWSLTA